MNARHSRLRDSAARSGRSDLRLFSYVVARDYGFAPNPFFSRCTLATCKPRIRGTASLGDWVIGTGSQQKNRRGYLVYAMEVDEIMTFGEYWLSPRYRMKRPNLRGSWKQAYGDNIYWRDDRGQWMQLDSHHSYANGTVNEKNVNRDTSTDQVLAGKRFAYFGGVGPRIPVRFRDYEGHDICAQRGHKCRFPAGMVNDFVAWFHGLGVQGFCGRPFEWQRKA